MSTDDDVTGSKEVKEDDDNDSDDSFFSLSSPLTESKDSKPIKLTRCESTYSIEPPRASEFVVYDTSQIRLKYLIEVTSKDWLRDRFNSQQKDE